MQYRHDGPSALARPFVLQPAEAMKEFLLSAPDMEPLEIARSPEPAPEVSL